MRVPNPVSLMTKIYLFQYPSNYIANAKVQHYMYSNYQL